jgi:hypothetical protein
MSVWALGRIASKITFARANKVLVKALQDPYFKVRANACTAISRLSSAEAGLSQ